jgi:hypothetical protein
MDDEKSTPQGPVDPHGPGGIDAPAPPGGPQRTDAPSGPDTPGEPGRDPGPGTERVTKRPEPPGGSVAPEDVRDQPGHRPDARDPEGDAERAAQLENAETSQDEPSDG